MYRNSEKLQKSGKNLEIKEKIILEMKAKLEGMWVNQQIMPYDKKIKRKKVLNEEKVQEKVPNIEDSQRFNSHWRKLTKSLKS